MAASISEVGLYETIMAAAAQLTDYPIVIRAVASAWISRTNKMDKKKL